MKLQVFFRRGKNFLKLCGLMGRAKKVEYYLAKEENAGYSKNIREWELFLKEIKSKYTEIRLHKLWSTRIGEYITRYATAVENAAENEKRGILDVFVLSDCVQHNSRLSQIMGRHIYIIDETNTEMWTYILRRFANVRFAKYWDDYAVEDRTRLRNSKETMHYFALTEEEECEGINKMKLMQLNQPYVCVAARDSAYLRAVYPLEDCTYHDYRDSDINKFNMAAAYLSQEGIVAVRMGREVARPVEFENCIDYASNYYDELLDIVLAQKCKFFVGDGSGIIYTPMYMNVPLAIKNLVPVFRECGPMPSNPNNLFIFKKYFCKSENRYLPIREMMQIDKKIGDMGSKGYIQQGIEVVENSAEEILDLVVEMNERLDGTWVEKPEDIELQDKFQKLFREWCEQQHYQEGGIIRMRVGTLFLKKNSYLLD